MKKIYWPNAKKLIRIWLIAASVMLLMQCKPDKPVSVLVVTGGHVYDTANFLRMWDEMEGVTYDTLIQPSGNRLYDQPKIASYDVLVFYDMYQEISGEQKEAFLRLLNQGIGVVFLHHSIASYQDWDEYLNILGAHYSEDTSGYQEKLNIPVQIVNPEHPVTAGMSDFEIFDETYFNVRVLPEVTPLLKTNHPQSMPLMGWTHRYGNSTIVYLQSGHDNNAFHDLNYRKLVQQAIVWSHQTI